MGGWGRRVSTKTSGSGALQVERNAESPNAKKTKYLRFRAAAAVVITVRHLVERAGHSRTEAPEIGHFLQQKMPRDHAG